MNGSDVWDGVECTDEQHIAAAIYLLTKAVALREQPGFGWPSIHAALRDATAHCEAARLQWTPEAMARMEQIKRDLNLGGAGK